MNSGLGVMRGGGKMRLGTAPVRAGIIGCGNISDIYCHNLKRWGEIELAACADLVPERAQVRAKQHGIPQVMTVK